MTVRRKMRRVVALAVVICTASLAIGATAASAHPPNTRVFSAGVINLTYTRMTIAFSCRAYALDAIVMRIKACYTVSANGERHSARSVVVPGPAATTGSVANLPFMPYKLCVDAVSTHRDLTTWDTGTRCYY